MARPGIEVGFVRPRWDPAHSQAATTGGTLTNPPLEKSSAGFSRRKRDQGGDDTGGDLQDVHEVAQGEITPELSRRDAAEIDACLGHERLLHAVRRAQPDDAPIQLRRNGEAGEDVPRRPPAGKRDRGGRDFPFSIEMVLAIR